ncbi:ribokinase [Leucobacter sp. HNU]|uniref:ribokinase n=1 Tax=Leucobacter sp. HNU TaxID=3236805 RepID=UPI003A80876D
MTDVAVVGSANADLVVEVPRRPGGGETLIGGELRTLPGGKGANQAAAAARSGAATAFVGCVGDDGNGAFLRSRLSEAGADVSALASVDAATGTAIILLTPDGENSIVVSPGANHAFDLDAAARVSAVWEGAPVVVLSLEIPHETAFHVASAASTAGSRVLLNAAPSVRVGREVLQHCDPLVVNEHEALEVLGASSDDPDADDYPRLAQRLLAAGARSVVVTLGSEGALVAEGSAEAPEIEAVPAYRVSAVDTTGAGDAFVGATAAELARGRSLREAVRFATAVSAVAVQRVGAQSSYADRAEVEEFIASHA